jgi:hypothetical protein
MVNERYSESLGSSGEHPSAASFACWVRRTFVFRITQNSAVVVTALTFSLLSSPSYFRTESQVGLLQGDDAIP